MKQGITLKLQIKPTMEQAVEFENLQEQYRKACQFVSDCYFETNFQYSRFKLHDRLYQSVRQEFELKSQQAQSVFITVLARYKTIDTLMKKKRYRYQDIHTKEWHSVQKDMHWMRKPVQFKNPQNDMVYNRDWRFTKEGTVRITTLNALEEVGCHFDYFDSYLSDGWKLGTAKLVNKFDKWFLHIGATKELE